MNKKGELSINYIILFIIALIVLIVVVIIFRNQIGDFVERITGLISNIFAPVEDIEFAAK
ncbi:MAG: hypothetical protein ABIJ18_05155 [archaeon]